MSTAKIYNKGTTVQFNNRFIESLTRTHFLVPVTMYSSLALAVIAYAAYIRFPDPWRMLYIIPAGILSFSVVEYFIHRYIFHFEAKNHNQELIKYKIHGVHHEYPRDKERLAMPPVFSICLLNDKLWAKDETAHHRFRLEDRQTGRVLKDTIEIHLVELPKYNLDRERLSAATPIERWAFLFQNSHLYTAEKLREMFPEEAFQLVISSVETIHFKTEYREMYETREKTLRDYDWKINTARDEGIVKGREEGRETVARNLLKIALPIPEIAKATGLTQIQIRKLSKKPQK